MAKKSVAKKAAKKAVRYEQDVLGIGEVYVAPMPPPPTQQEVERSRCPHGVVRGLYYQSQPNSDRLVCGDCDAVYPSHRRSVDPETWGAQVPGLLWYLHDNSIECTDSARSAMARTIGHAAFLDRFHIITVLTPDQKHTERLYVAWVAEQLEPGRVEQVLADALPHGGTRLYAVTSHPFEEQPRG